MLLAIDPGNIDSAFAVLDGERLVRFGKLKNADMLSLFYCGDFAGFTLYLEMVASYGMPVGQEIFETCYWVGRFEEAHNLEAHRVFRKEIKLHLCGSPRAKDSNVRQALIDRYGANSHRKGGLLYGVTKDVWAALAVGVFALDLTEGRVNANTGR